MNVYFEIIKYQCRLSVWYKPRIYLKLAINHISQWALINVRIATIDMVTFFTVTGKQCTIEYAFINCFNALRRLVEWFLDLNLTLKQCDSQTCLCLRFGITVLLFYEYQETWHYWGIEKTTMSFSNFCWG